MKKVLLILFFASLLGACAFSTKTAKEYDIECFDSGIVEENGFYVKRIILGNRFFSIHIEELTKKDDSIRFKGVLIDNKTTDTISLVPTVCLISGECPKYKIEKEFYVGNYPGKFDFAFQWDFRKGHPKIVIDALTYHGGVYIIKPKINIEEQKNDKKTTNSSPMQ
ncbi:MAG: hypothetical protein IJQ89_01895 [Bacteroidales bacterium]|nr:hypothetical protein [Bacteroidales bacterium]